MSPVTRERPTIRVAGNLLWVAVAAWYLLSGSGGDGGAATAPIDTGAGTITFGTGIDEADGSVKGEASVFHPGDSIAWSASLAESTEATELRLRVSQVANNDKSVETVTFEIEEGMADVIWPAEEIRVTRDMVGVWTLEVLHGDEVLATGSFMVRVR